MYRDKSVALVCAFIAALLVMLAGKSCADDIVETNKKNAAKKSSSAATDSITQINDFTINVTAVTEPSSENVEYVTNMIGQVVGTVPPPPSTAPVTETEPVYITDLIGRVVGTEPPPETVPPQTTEKSTVTKSILEEYNEKYQPSTTPVAENTQAYDPDATFPSDFVIYVD